MRDKCGNGSHEFLEMGNLKPTLGVHLVRRNEIVNGAVYYRASSYLLKLNMLENVIELRKDTLTTSEVTSLTSITFRVSSQLYLTPLRNNEHS